MRLVGQLAILLLGAAAAGAAALALFLAVLTWGFGGYDADSSATLSPPRSRDAVFQEWSQVADQLERQHLAEEMIRDNHLIGMSREQVLAVLGKPHPRNLPGYGDPKYVVGPSGIDDMWLCIYVEDGKVVKAMLRSD